MEELRYIYYKAKEFTEMHHKPDVEILRDMKCVLPTFELFYKEYCYCVVASGFRGSVAARISAYLAECQADKEKCLSVFKNNQKVSAICSCYALLKDDYAVVSSQWKRPEDLCSLPYIGPVTCYHLARNIGLLSCVKPDLHLMRLIRELFNADIDEKFVQYKVIELAHTEGQMPGVVDFCLWVWLSHNHGEVSKCCDGGLRLR